MTLNELVHKNRSYRRFDQKFRIIREDLEDLVNLARLCPSGRNLQTLKYFISTDPELNARIFPHLAWAGYLKDWDGPIEGERPTGYIIIIEDNAIGKNLAIDQGIAAQTIMLGAADKGLGGCMIHSVKRKELSEVLGLKKTHEICLVLALGKVIEKVILEELPTNGDIKYWRDSNNIHHVPKRSLMDLIIM